MLCPVLQGSFQASSMIGFQLCIPYPPRLPKLSDDKAAILIPEGAVEASACAYFLICSHAVYLVA